MADPRIDTADNLFAAALYRSAEQVDERLERTRYLQGAQKEVQMVAQDLFSGSPKARQKTQNTRLTSLSRRCGKRPVRRQETGSRRKRAAPATDFIIWAVVIGNLMCSSSGSVVLSVYMTN